MEYILVISAFIFLIGFIVLAYKLILLIFKIDKSSDKKKYISRKQDLVLFATMLITFFASVIFIYQDIYVLTDMGLEKFGYYKFIKENLLAYIPIICSCVVITSIYIKKKLISQIPHYLFNILGITNLLASFYVCTLNDYMDKRMHILYFNGRSHIDPHFLISGLIYFSFAIILKAAYVVKEENDQII